MAYWVAAFILTRIVYLFTVHPFYLFEFQYEELFRGAIARDLIHGLSMPLWEYRADDYAGGCFIQGILTIPFFLVFGLNAFALKLGSVAVFAGMLVFWFHMLDKYCGRSSAALFSVLTIFAPRSFFRFSIIPLGDHAETLLISAASLWLALRLFEQVEKAGKINRPGKIGLFALGLLGGFGVWFAYIYSISLLALGGLAWLRGWFRMLRRADFMILTAGMLVGFSPWIMINFQSGWAGLDFFKTFMPDLFFDAHREYGLLDWKQSSLYRIAASFFLTDSSDGEIQRWTFRLYPFLCIGPILLSAGLMFFERLKFPFRQDAQLQNPVLQYALIYAGLFTVIFHFVGVKAQRYLTPVYPVLFILWAMSVTYLGRRFSKGLPHGRTLLIVAVTASSLLGIWPRLTADVSLWGLAARLKGYSYDWLSEAPVAKNTSRLLDFARQVESKLDPEAHFSFLHAIASQLSSVQDLSRLDEEINILLPKMPEKLKPLFFYYLGREIMSRVEPHIDQGEKLGKSLQQRAGPYARWLWMGLREGTGEMTLKNHEDLAGAKSFFPTSDDEVFTRAYAQQILTPFFQGLESENANSVPYILQQGMSFADTYAASGMVRQWFFEVFGSLLYRHWLAQHETLKILPQHLEWISAEDRFALMRGAGAAFYDGNRTFPLIYGAFFIAHLSSEDRREAMEGFKTYLHQFEKMGIPIRADHFYGHFLWNFSMPRRS